MLDEVDFSDGWVGSSKVGFEFFQVSDKVEGNSDSQKRKRLSGKLLTNVMDLLFSRGGGRILSLWRVACVMNSAFL